MSRSNGDSSAARPGERLPELGRVHPPGALDPLDHGRFADLGHVGRLDRARRSARAGDAQRGQPPLVADAPGLVGRDHRVARVDTFGQVPEPVAAAAARHRDLAAQDHVLEHLGDVAVVGPAGRLPGHRAQVGKLPGRQRPGRREPLEDVPAADVVGADPVPDTGVPAGNLPGAGPVPRRHVRPVQRKVLGRPDERPQLDQGADAERVGQVGRIVGRAEAAPGHQVRVRRDRADRVNLQQRQPPHGVQQPVRPRPVQQLSPHRDPPRVRQGQLVHSHPPRLRNPDGELGETGGLGDLSGLGGQGPG